MRRRYAWSAVLLLAPASVRADDANVAAAADLFKEGRAAMARGDLAEACKDFAQSAKLDPRVGTLLNLAQCEESRGRLHVARQFWRDAAELAHATHDARESIARERLVEIEKRIPTLSMRLDVAAPGVKVSCDGVPASIGSPFQVDPGAHEVVVTAPGRLTTSTAVVVKESDRRVIDLQVGAPVAAPVPPTDGAPGSSPTRSALVWSLGGLSVASLAVGSWFGAQAIRRNDDSKRFCDVNNACQPEGLDLRGDASRDARISTIAFGVGGAALAGALVVWLTAPRTPTKPTIALAVLPTSIRVEGRW